MHDRADGILDEHRLVEYRFDPGSRWRRRDDFGQPLAHALDDVHGRSAAELDQGHRYRAATIHPGHAALKRGAIAYRRDVAQQDDITATFGDGKVKEGTYIGRTGVERDLQFALTFAQTASGQGWASPLQGSGDILGCQPLDMQCLRIEIDHDLARRAAIGQGHANARYRLDLCPKLQACIVVKLGLGEAIRSKHQLQNRCTGDVVAHHQRRHRSLGHATQNGL